MPAAKNKIAGQALKPCVFYIVRYVSNLLRGDKLNIGVLLHCPEENYLECLFCSDFRWLRRIDPNSDLDFLNELQEDFERQIALNERNHDAYLGRLSESLSNTVQLDEPRPCLVQNPVHGLQEIYSRYVGRGSAPARAEDTRFGVKRRLTAALVDAGVWQHLEKRVAADRWTEQGDPFTFDYGYKPNGAIHFLHALSLKRDTQLAKTLSYTLDCVRRHERAELVAVVDAMPAPADQIALATHGILRGSGIEIQPVEAAATLASSIRKELRIT